MIPNCLSRFNGNYEPAHEILVLIPLVSKEGSDEPAQMHGLSRAFPAGIYKVCIKKDEGLDRKLDL